MNAPRPTADFSDAIRTEINGAIARITLNRPDALNAFGGDMRERLVAALDRVAAAPGVRVLVITGAGRAFCAGGDVRHMEALVARGASFDELAPLLALGRAIVTRIHALPFPTLAAVNGPAAGAGMNLALACDIRWASDAASFGETFAQIGLHPDWGGTYFLPRLAGLSRALELCWTAAMIGAEEAQRQGIVSRVVPAQQFAAEVDRFAEKLALTPQASARAAKRTLRASLARDLEQCLDAEEEAQAECWASPDVAEGLRSFVEKRRAHYTALAPAAAGPRFE
jgi:2-(1,2-epoxy-1,2-dihydrophenyl)acetyl-CoA isomerase